jgi:YD repeat-containing protein
MKKLIRKILREEINKSDKYYRFLDKISSIIEIPYFRNMYERYNGGFWDITDEDDQLYILKNIFGEGHSFSYVYKVGDIYDENDNRVYWENSNGYWAKREYDENGNEIYYENSDGYWVKKEYDENGNEIYFENSNDFWRRFEYDDNGNLIYHEDSNGWWEIQKYDDKGNRIYWEDSDGWWEIQKYDDKGNRIYYETSEGDIIDNR